MKRQPMDREKIFINDVIDKGLISKTVHILNIIKFLQNSDTFKQINKFSFLDETWATNHCYKCSNIESLFLGSIIRF